MIFNEIKCHVNTSLGLVGGIHPLHPPRVRAWQLLILYCFSHVKIFRFLDISFCMFKPVCTFKQV